MPEKSFKDKAQKYKSKYYSAKAGKQSGGNNKEMTQDHNTSNNVISMVNSDVDTPDNLDYLSE